MNKLFWGSFARITFAFGIIYLSLFLLSGVFIHLIDYIDSKLFGHNYVDGWTTGVMVWIVMIYAFPLIYVLYIGVTWVRLRGKI